MMWDSGYPHAAGVFQDSAQYIYDYQGAPSADDIRKITCDNAVKFYDLV